MLANKPELCFSCGLFEIIPEPRGTSHVVSIVGALAISRPEAPSGFASDYVNLVMSHVSIV